MHSILPFGKLVKPKVMNYPKKIDIALEKLKETTSTNDYLARLCKESKAKEFYTVCPDNPRAMSAEELANRIRALGVKATPCASVAEGVAKAIEAEGKDGIVCALGSLYMSGDIRVCFPEKN